MSFCSYADGAAMFDATPIENLFLMEYMFDAPGPALKVYLYARMLALHPELGGTLEDMAKALHVPEGEVYDSFTYWENMGLVRRLSDQPPTYAFNPMRSPTPAAGTALDREMYANREFNSRLRRLFNDQFIGDHEIRKAADWMNILKYEQDAILRLVEYAIHQSPKQNPKPPSVFKRADGLAEAWSKQGARTLEDVEKLIAEETGEANIARQVLKKMGMYRNPTQPELELVRKWTKAWGFDEAGLLAACDKTTSANKPSFAYLDGILQNQRGDSDQYFREVSDVLKELNPQSAQPSPDQLARYKALIDKGFDPDMILLAAVQCHRANKYRFDDLEWRLNLWREDGVTTPTAANDWMKQMTALATELRRVFRQAGYEDRRPSDKDVLTYRGWRDSYPAELIEYAAQCARSAGGSMAYMEKLLTGWAQAGATTLAQAQAQHEAHRQGQKMADGKPLNTATNFTPRETRGGDDGDDFDQKFEELFGSGGDKA